VADARLPLVFDGHNDVLLELHRGARTSFFARGDEGHLDLPRARAGGLAGGLFAIFAPTEPDPFDALRETPTGSVVPDVPPLPDGAALAPTRAMLALAAGLEATAPGEVHIVRAAGELDACLADGRLAIVLHLEGAEALGARLEHLDELQTAGVRSIGMTWSRPNAFGHGVPFRLPSSPDTGPGLTAAGRALVIECRARGLLVDLAHLNERGFWDVAGMEAGPLVVSHSACHALAPCARNLTDAQLEAIGAADGLVGIGFISRDLRADGRERADVPLARVCEHIEHAAERAGIEHVGLGSDFDGTTVPAAIGDAAGLPRLLRALRERGWDEGALAKLAHGNWRRVLRAAWAAG
jgi:membrane dipeptidase